jgi:acyl-CoA thioester hydrolase
MFHADRNELTATSEHLAVHVDMESRRSDAFPAERLEAIAALAAAHAVLPTPERVGRRMGIRR